MDEVLNFMREPVASLDSQASAVDAAKLMAEKDISSVLVVEGGDYVGIVTRTDLVTRVLAPGLDAAATRLKDVMSGPLVTMDHYLTAGDAHEFMARKRLKHLPITREGKVVGMLTTKDLVG
jgi:signal-transduction protein with cAMP-binding, CBS, and nucleotidyltransferase domain